MSTPTFKIPVQNADLARQAVVAAARSWIGTPYHHMGRVKGAGADCATLLAEVYTEAGLCTAISIEYYPQDWMLHRSEERYLGILEQYVREIEGPPEPGDIVMYHFGRCWSHGAIVIAWPTIVHAVLGQNVCLGDGERDGIVVGRSRRYFSAF
jgi:cell wall-associated NlpC family hydrolase